MEEQRRKNFGALKEQMSKQTFFAAKLAALLGSRAWLIGNENDSNKEASLLAAVIKMNTALEEILR